MSVNIRNREKQGPKAENTASPEDHFVYCILANFFQLSAEEIEATQDFFDGISRVLMVTGNEKKLSGLRSWLHQKLVIIRGAELIPIDKIHSDQEEPRWDQALLVAIDKTRSGIAELRTSRQKKKSSGSTAVFGSDIVLMINGQPSLNLSREIPKDYRDNPEKYEEYTQIINAHIERLKEAYCQPSGATLAYDVALAISAEKNGKYYQAVTGVRVVIKLRSMPTELVESTIKPLVPGTKIKKSRPVTNHNQLFTINAGIPIVDERSVVSVFTQFIESVTIVPIRLLADDDGSVEHDSGLETIGDKAEIESYDFTKITQEDRAKILAKLHLILVGGIPPNANKLVQNYVGKDQPNGYIIY